MRRDLVLPLRRRGRPRKAEAMLVRQMLIDMWDLGAAAAAEDIGNAMAYDPDYAHEHAEALAMQVITAARMSYAVGRELATEWMDGYKSAYADEIE